MFPLESLRIFESEIENLFCGEQTSDWSDAQKLTSEIVATHGYTKSSRAYLYFIKYIAQLEPANRPAFIQFLTGSPRLPLGGFGGLDPCLTVVLKKSQNENPDKVLPSVMTCQNYVKMPPYTTFEILKQQFDFAVREGASNFTLS